MNRRMTNPTIARCSNKPENPTQDLKDDRAAPAVSISTVYVVDI